MPRSALPPLDLVFLKTIHDNTVNPADLQPGTASALQRNRRNEGLEIQRAQSESGERQDDGRLYAGRLLESSKKKYRRRNGSENDGNGKRETKLLATCLHAEQGKRCSLQWRGPARPQLGLAERYVLATAPAQGKIFPDSRPPASSTSSIRRVPRCLLQHSSHGTAAGH